MGSLVSREQLQHVQAGLAALRPHTETLFSAEGQPWLDADPAVAACAAPVLLGSRAPDDAEAVHRLEVFGPVATLMPYRDPAHAAQLVRRGEGSLVVSLFGADAAELGAAALELADCHGRVHLVSPDVGASHSGHGNVMPQSLHGGPGRAGGGEELGGLRALRFYHRLTAVQAAAPVLDRLGGATLPI
jgi:3,4-dehydroadipyl-CoA semialdehyde dehydrogenase